MTFSLTACGGNNSGKETSADANKTQQSTTPAQEESKAPEQEEAKASTQEPETEKEAVETVKLNVAYMPNYASLWSVLTAMDQGYFEEEGLEITLWEFADGPSEIAAMEGGSIDLAYIGHGAHRLCINGQATIFAPSSVHSTDKIIVLPSS